MNPTALTPEEARADLAAVRQQRLGAVARAKTPRWYHPLLGLCIGSLIASFASHSLAVIAPVGLLFAVSLGVLVGAYRKSTGLWVSSIQGPATKRVITSYFIVVSAVYLAGFVLDVVLDFRAGWLVLGVIMVVAMIEIGNRWDTAFAQDADSADDRA